jgi:hypothetical protein
MILMLIFNIYSARLKTQIQIQIPEIVSMTISPPLFFLLTVLNLYIEFLAMKYLVPTNHAIGVIRFAD